MSWSSPLLHEKFFYRFSTGYLRTVKWRLGKRYNKRSTGMWTSLTSYYIQVITHELYNAYCQMCLAWSSLLFFFFLFLFFFFFFLSLGHPFNRTTFHLPPILGDYIEEDEVGGAYHANGRDWQQPLVGQGLLIIEVSRSHSDTPHSLGLFRTSDQPDTKTST